MAADTKLAPRSGARPQVFVPGADPGLGLVGGTGGGGREIKRCRDREDGDRMPRLSMKLLVTGLSLSVSVSRQTDRQTSPTAINTRLPS